MESGGKSRIVPGSQEVTGSIPICSTPARRSFSEGGLFLFTKASFGEQSPQEACEGETRPPKPWRRRAIDYQGITDFEICDPFLFCQVFASRIVFIN